MLVYVGVVAALAAATFAAAGAPLSNDPVPLAVCEDTIRTAAIKLTSEARRAVSKCLTRGIECLVDEAKPDEPCCRDVARRCPDDLARLGRARQQFARVVQSRRCRLVSFADLLGSGGLGYGTLADACGGLTPPGAVGDLAGLADCIARSIVSETSCGIGTNELPRSAEALACAGLGADFETATGADLLSCNGAGPAPSPSASPTTSEATSTPSVPEDTATPTATPIRTSTSTPAETATPTTTGTATAATTSTVTTTPTVTVTQLSTPTVTPTAIATATQSAGATPTGTPTPVVTRTPTSTAATTSTAVTSTVTPTPVVTPTRTVTATPTPTAALTPTASVAKTATATPTASATVTPTLTSTPVVTATVTTALTATPIRTATPTATITPTPTKSTTPTVTRTPTPTKSRTPTPSPTSTPRCGNGVTEPPEECDDNNTASGDGCDANCTVTRCGNGVKTAGEDCDDGNTFSCDTCPKDCKTSAAPVACTAVAGTHSQHVHLAAPPGAVLSGGVFCIDYPAGVVALPSTGLQAGSRVSGMSGVLLNDFNNAVQLSFAVNPGQQIWDPIINFDLCTGQTAPPPTAFVCVTKSASSMGQTLDTAAVECSPVTP